MNRIAVVGGGITGVTTAYALARRGLAVTLFEQHRYAGMDTSFANGGQLSACNAEAWANWANVAKALKWMLKRDAPLLLNPRPGWHKLSWFAQFLAGIRCYRSATVESTRMAIAARDHLFSWAAAEGIEFDLRRQGILHVYRDRAGWDHAAKVSQLLAQGGLDRQPVTPAEMRAIEPALTGNWFGGYYTASDATGDIHKFTTGLAAAAERLGVRILYGTDVRALQADGRTARVIVGSGRDAQEYGFDGLAVCAGVASRRFARQLGDRVDIYPVKGYSITVNLLDARSQEAAPTVSLHDDDTKLVTSRLGIDRFRVAGTAEFNGFNRDIRADRILPLVEWVQRHFPQVGTRQVVPWAGLRPMMPGMLPRVGRGRHANVYYNTGHGHLGWTLSAFTADEVATLITQEARA